MIEPDSLQEKIGISFRDITLLRQALVHRSYLNEAPNGFSLASNERLEFLGDAFLGYAVAEKLYQEFPDFHEGNLTKLRSALVRTDTLARIGRSLNLGEYLYLSKGEDESGGRIKRRNLACAVEAVIGAVLLDQGPEKAMQFVVQLLYDEFHPTIEEKLEKDPKSKLQEVVQAYKQVTPTYRTVGSSGPDHEKTFVVEVFVGDALMGYGTGKSKRRAEKAAARDALLRLEGELGLV